MRAADEVFERGKKSLVFQEIAIAASEEHESSLICVVLHLQREFAFLKGAFVIWFQAYKEDWSSRVARYQFENVFNKANHYSLYSQCVLFLLVLFILSFDFFFFFFFFFFFGGGGG